MGLPEVCVHGGSCHPADVGQNVPENYLKNKEKSCGWVGRQDAAVSLCWRPARPGAATGPPCLLRPCLAPPEPSLRSGKTLHLWDEMERLTLDGLLRTQAVSRGLWSPEVRFSLPVPVSSEQVCPGVVGGHLPGGLGTPSALGLPTEGPLSWKELVSPICQ